jgi:CPA2 family monovalent cation:H+ antiporter-2
MAGEVAAGIAVVVAIAAFVVVLFHKIRQPVVVGYIIAGLLLSMVAVPLIALVTQTQTITPAFEQSIRSVIGGIASLGLMLLLFSIGLEFNLQRLRKTGLRLIIIGTVEMVIVFASGYLLGLGIGFTPLQAVFLGAAISAASTTVLVKLLSQAGRRFTREGDLVVGVLIVEDLMIVIVLTALVGFAQGAAPNLLDVAVVATKIGIFFVSSILLGTLVVPRLVDHVASLKVPEILLVVALGLGFGMALFSTALGLSEAIGAFVMGLIVGEARAAERVRHLVQPVRDLFVAVFFVSIGMLIDPSALVLPAVIVAGVAIAAVFIAAKFLGLLASSLLVGTEMPVAVKAGVSILALGEFSLVVARMAGDPASGVFPGARASEFLLMVLLAVIITSVISAQTIRNMDAIDAAVERRMPSRLKEFSLSFTDFRRSLGRDERARDEHMKAVYAEASRAGLDLAIIATVVSVGALAGISAPQLAPYTGLPLSGLQMLLVAAVILISAPPFRDVVLRMGRIVDLLATEIEHRSSIGQRFGKRMIAGVMRSLVVAVTALVLALGAVVAVTSLPSFTPFHLLILVPPLLLFGWFFWGAFEQVHRRFQGAVELRIAEPAAIAGDSAAPPNPVPARAPSDAERSSTPPAPLDPPPPPPD